MTNHMDYLKEKLRQAKDDVERYKRGIKEEEKRTQKFETRVVVETKAFGDWDWRRTVLVHLNLTLEQRDRLIESLRWLRNVGK